MKGEKMIKTSSSLGSRMRKRLSDITNLNSQNKSPFKNLENVAIDSSSSSYTKNYVDQILKENATMSKLIEEKDKIIESRALELQMVKVNLQRTQLQNYQLAQTNSQMLAELNVAKDRLKALQHEFICKEALVKAMAVERKEVESKPEAKLETKPEEPALEPQPPVKNDKKEESKVSKVENKVSKTKRGPPARSQSMGATTSTSQADKEIMENKRRCLRRQSMRLKPSEKQDELFEIDVANKPDNQTMDSNSRRNSNSDAVSNNEECLSEPSKHGGARRASIGRPQRRATDKVQSYKDPPLNKKMRRPV